ncbi:MAG: RHS repeat-associated core domain-containing protein, partial [Planctomycetota bacterium]
MHYFYDDAGRLDLTRQYNGPLTGDAEGAGDDVLYDYVYDAHGRLDQLRVSLGGVWDDAWHADDFDGPFNGDARPLLHQDITYEADSQRDAMTELRWRGNETDTSAAAFSDVLLDWSYDDLGRLTQEVRNERAGGSGEFDLAGLDYRHAYAHDLAGNRVRRIVDADNDGSADAGDGNTTGYAYDARNRLVGEDRDGDASYDEVVHDYDAAGNTTRVATEGEPTVASTWDLRGRLTQRDVGDDGDLSGEGDAVYTYDAGGLRVGKRTGDGSGSGIVEETLLLDRRNPTGYAQVLESTVGDGSGGTGGGAGDLAMAYLLGLDVIAQAEATDGTGGGDGEAALLLYDAGGHTRGLVDATGQIATGQVYAYDAFGRWIEDPANAVTPATSLLYRGEFYDAESGTYYLRGRPAYDPSTGRFTSQDPREAGPGDLANANLYLYANGEPIGNSDPSGLFSMPEILNANGVQATLQGLKTSAINYARQWARQQVKRAAVRAAENVLFELLIARQINDTVENLALLGASVHGITFGPTVAKIASVVDRVMDALRVGGAAASALNIEKIVKSELLELLPDKT